MGLTYHRPMSADIINLRRKRKEKSRGQAAAEAEANRIRFGRSLAEKRGTEAEAERARRRLDGHRLDAVEDDPGKRDA